VLCRGFEVGSGTQNRICIATLFVYHFQPTDIMDDYLSSFRSGANASANKVKTEDAGEHSKHTESKRRSFGWGSSSWSQLMQSVKRQVDVNDS
jgi:hypothetical protein